MEEEEEEYDASVQRCLNQTRREGEEGEESIGKNSWKSRQRKREEREGGKTWRGWRSGERAETQIPGYSGSHECMDLSYYKMLSKNQ